MSWSWTCVCAQQVTEETCAACGHWQCALCKEVVPPRTGCPRCHVGKQKTAVGGQTTRISIARTGVEAVWIETLDGERRSQSQTPENDPADPDPRFAFSPGREVSIRWELHGNTSSVHAGALEVAPLADPERILWRRELTEAEVQAGALRWDGAVDPARPDGGEELPEGLLTAAGGPYELRFIARSRATGRLLRLKPDRGWTRFGVAPWIEVSLRDPDGEPVAGARYTIELPDQQVVEGTLDDQGQARHEGIPAGECQVRFPGLDGGAWAREASWLEIELVEAGGPVPHEPYRVELPDGTVREGKLDARGLARLDGIPRGTCQVGFPRLDARAWARDTSSA